jgi:hypothetical protein
MIIREACDILEIKESETHHVCSTPKLLKQKYTKLALKYHPDKNPQRDTSDEFREVQEAYSFLKELYTNNSFVEPNEEFHESPDYESNIPSYLSIMRVFLGTVDDPHAIKYLDDILEKILNVCEKHAEQMIDNLEGQKFNVIYKLLDKYRHVFQLSPKLYDLMEKRKIFLLDKEQNRNRRRGGVVHINDPNANLTYHTMYDYEWDIDYEIATEKTENENTDGTATEQDIFLVEPSLEDLWCNNVYQYTKNGSTILIPLWHHELVYEIQDKDLVVKIKPRLPSNYWIDEDNNLHRMQEYTMSELWDGVVNEKGINVFFGNKRFVFYPYKLLLKTHQTWTWDKQGIPEIQEDSIYDISRKRDIILHIHITGIH